MPKMYALQKRYKAAGTRVSVFGYPGIIDENGVVIVDVPESLYEVELHAGRMLQVQQIQQTSPAESGTESDISPTSRKK